MIEIRLSQKQQEIVGINTGAILVRASAGSGKTRVLTERIKRLINITKRKILAITFTNKAGEEMKERIGKSISLNDRLYVGTFHGFCDTVLSTHGDLIGFKNIPHIFENETDRLELVEQAIEKTPSYYNAYLNADKKKQSEMRSTALNFIAEVKRNLQTADDLLENGDDEELVLLYNTYQEILDSQNAIDYDDLISLTYNLFIENPKIAALYRRTYEYICIDEAQDLNYAQYQLIRAITGTEHKNVMMVGDPNQSIFAFVGSSAEYMNEMFVEDYKPHIIELKENYRSSINVLNAAEKIIPGACDFTNAVIHGIFEIYAAEHEEAETQWIINKIEELVRKGDYKDIEGKVTYDKIAIIARNKYLFKVLAEKLGDIPYYYKITPGAIQFESKLFKIFDLAFKVRLNPKDTLHWHKLLTVLKIKTAESLMEIKEIVKDEWGKMILETVITLEDNGSNFLRTFENLKKTFIASDIEENEKEFILNDIDELRTHWLEYARKTDNKSLLQFKNAMALGKTHPLTQKKGVTLSTVHTMKGQEYDIVFLIGMDDETFPDYRAINDGDIELKQERNNAYVAFTRAKRFLYVTWPKIRHMPWGEDKRRRRSRFLVGF